MGVGCVVLVKPMSANSFLYKVKGSSNPGC